MRIFNRLPSLISLTVILFVPVAVHAQSQSQGQTSRQEASELSFSEVVERAQKAYSNESYDEAIRLLVRAYSMRSNARLLFNIAKSYEKQNLCGTALVYYRAYINHPGTEKKLMDAAEAKMEKVDECEAYSDDLAGRLMVGTTPPGATVEVDGEPYGHTPTEVAPLKAGTHELVIEKEGYERVSIALDLESGKKKQINQILQKQEPRETASADNQANESPNSAGTDSGGRTSAFWPIHPAAFALGVGGIGGLTVGSVYDLVLIPATDEKRRNADRDSDRFQRLSDQRDNQETIALVGYIGGGLLLATGVVWHVIDVSTDEGPSAMRGGDRGTTWGLSASPRSIGLQLRFF